MFHFKLKFGKDVPHILYDGIVDSEQLTEAGIIPDASQICVRGNTNETFANLDAENGFKNISRDVSPYDCALQPIGPIDEPTTRN